MKRIDCFAYGETECTILEQMECDGCKFYKSRGRKQNDDIRTIKRLKSIGYPEKQLKKLPGYDAYLMYR